MESDHFDFIILGTSLPLSILSSALSRAGYKILHIDQNDYYGGDFASLNLIDLVKWIDKNKKTSGSDPIPKGRYWDFHLDFPYFDSEDQEESKTTRGSKDLIDSIPETLSNLSRHFSISLKPLLIPSVGPLIEDLISSKVNDYCTFRLLGQTLIFNSESPNAASASSTLESHSSSEMSSSSSPGEIENQTVGALGALTKVPSSKSDIFSSKSIQSLIEKRKLMKLLTSILKDEEWPKEFGEIHPHSQKLDGNDDKQSKENASSFGFEDGRSESKSQDQSQPEADKITHKYQSLPELLKTKYKLSKSSLEAILYAIALYPSDSSSFSLSASNPTARPSVHSSTSSLNFNPSLKSSLETAQIHLQSLGRYGDSPFLISQYGGSSEILEGFNRNSAVFGAVYIIGKEIERIEKHPKELESGEQEREKEKEKEMIYKIKLNDIDQEFSSDWLISSHDVSLEKYSKALVKDNEKGPPNNEGETDQEKLDQVDSVKGLLILDRPLPIGDLQVYLDDISKTTNDDNEGLEQSEKNLLPPETAMIIFPPGSLDDGEASENAAGEKAVKFSTSVLLMGEGTFSCPKGMYVYYLSTFAIRNPASGRERSSKEILSQVKNKLLDFANRCPAEFNSEAESASDSSKKESTPKLKALESPKLKVVKPIMEIYYKESLLDKSPKIPVADQISAKHLRSPPDSLPIDPKSQIEFPSKLELPNLISHTDNSSYLARQIFYLVQGLSLEESFIWATRGRPKRFQAFSKDLGSEEKIRGENEWNGRAGRGWDDPIEEKKREKLDERRNQLIDGEREQELDQEVQKRKNVKEWFGAIQRNENGEGEEDD